MGKYVSYFITVYLLVCVGSYFLPIHAAEPNPGYAQAVWNKSWIGIDYGTLMGHLVEGDMMDITVEYYLDPAEHFGTTKLLFEALGPRIPKPGIEGVQHIYSNPLIIFESLLDHLYHRLFLLCYQEFQGVISLCCCTPFQSSASFP